MGGREEIIAQLEKDAASYKKRWQKLPRSLVLEEPLPVKTSLELVNSIRNSSNKKDYPNPQGAIEAALGYGYNLIILLEAGPGSGKSSALLWAAHQTCNKLINDPDIFTNNCELPWYYNLKNATAPMGTPEPLDYLLGGRPNCHEGHSGLFFLDGLDLLPIENSFRESSVYVVNRARRLIADKNHRFVISSRPLPDIAAALEGPEDHWVICLDGLNESYRDGWLKKHPPLNQALDIIYAANPGSRTLSTNPLLFSMLLSLAQSSLDNHDEITITEHPGCAGLFAAFIDYLYQRPNIGKCPPEGGAHSPKLEVFEDVCWAAIVQGEVDHISETKLRDYLRTIDDGANAGEYFEIARADLCRTGIVKKDPSGSHFIHQGFMEHLGGRCLAARLNEASKGGWLQAELWDHLSHKRMDNLLAHGLGIMKTEDRMQSMKAVLYLLERYKSERDKLLEAADPEQAISLLDPFLDANDVAISQEASRALKEIDEPCQAQDSPVEGSANQAMVGVADSKIEEVYVGRHVTKASSPTRSSFAGRMDLLLSALTDENEEVQLFAKRELENISNPYVVTYLVAALNNPLDYVRTTVALALGNIKHPSAVPPLESALNDTNDEVRATAAWALGEIKDPVAVPHLLMSLHDHASNVRVAVALALGNIKHPSAVPPLESSLNDTNDEVRAAAVWALGEIGNPRNVESLAGAFNDPSEDVREEAIKALVKIGPQAAVGILELIIDTPYRELRRYALRTLWELQVSLSVDCLLAILEDRQQSEQIRKNAISKLLASSDPRVEGVLLAALKDKYGTVRSAAAVALSDLWKIEDPADPMRKLEAHASQVPDDIARDIARIWGRRWCGEEILPMMTFQRNLRKIGGESMTTVDKSINIGTVITQDHGNTAIGENAIAMANQTTDNHIDQSFSILRDAFRKGDILQQGYRPVTAEKALDALQEAHKSQDLQLGKKIWGALKPTINVAKLGEQVLTAFNTFKAFFGSLV